MSRAFVKKAEDKVEELPDRPISGYRNLVTHEGLMAIEAAHAGFEEAHREAITRNDAHAAAAALREVRYWRARRASAEVVRPPVEADTASFGRTVTLRRDDGREQTFRGRGRSVARDGVVRFAPRPGCHDVQARRYGRDSGRRGRDSGRAVEAALSRHRGG